MNISLKICVELKKAGFPQWHKSGGGKYGLYYHFNTVETEQDLWDWSENHLHVFDKAVMIPTLSELIEACGNDFYSLSYVGESGSEKMWEADSNNTDIFVYGKTPEEAVAYLFLKLKKDGQKNKKK